MEEVWAEGGEGESMPQSLLSMHRRAGMPGEEAGSRTKSSLNADYLREDDEDFHNLTVVAHFTLYRAGAAMPGGHVDTCDDLRRDTQPSPTGRRDCHGFHNSSIS